MTDQLSPAAQAVKIPFDRIVNVLHQYSRVSISYTDALPITIETSENGLRALVDELVAAALRAAANQVVPDDYDPPRGVSYPEKDAFVDGKCVRNEDIRVALLAIAAELEAL